MEIGTLEWWEDVVVNVLRNPHDFFRTLDREEDFKSPSIFVVVTQAIVAVFYILGIFFMAPSQARGIGSLIDLTTGVGSAFYLVLMVVYALFLTFLMAGTFHVIYHYLGGAGKLSATFKAVSYPQAIAIPGVAVVFLGMALSRISPALNYMVLLAIIIGIYGLYIQIVAASEVHEFSMWRAAAPYLLTIGPVVLGTLVVMGLS